MFCTKNNSLSDAVLGCVFSSLYPRIKNISTFQSWGVVWRPKGTIISLVLFLDFHLCSNYPVKSLTLTHVLIIYPVRVPPPSSQAAICRSSQPLSGFSARCLEDEQMLEAILRSNPRSDFMYVVDTRPKVSLGGSIQVLQFCAVCSGGTCFPHCVSPAACLHSYSFRNICKTTSETNRVNLVSCRSSWTPSQTELQEKAMRTKTTTPTSNSSLWASRTFM